MKSFLLITVVLSVIVPASAYGQTTVLNSNATPNQCLDFNSDKICEYIILANGTQVANPINTTVPEPDLVLEQCNGSWAKGDDSINCGGEIYRLDSGDEDNDSNDNDNDSNNDNDSDDLPQDGGCQEQDDYCDADEGCRSESVDCIDDRGFDEDDYDG
jgi:hypothetical protein